MPEAASSVYALPFGVRPITGGIMIPLTDGPSIPWDATGVFGFSLELGGNHTIENPTGLLAGSEVVLMITMGGSGSYIPVWGHNFLFPDGEAPVLSPAVGAIDILTFFTDGTLMYLKSIVQNLEASLDPPSDLTASNDEVGQVTLNWVVTDPTATETRVQRFDLVDWSTLADIDTSITTYVDVISDGTYPYRVISKKAAILSAPSNTADGTSLP